MRRFVQQHFLLIFVHRGHTRRAGHQYVAMSGRVAHLEDALARRKSPNLDLRCKNCGFIIVQKLE